MNLHAHSCIALLRIAYAQCVSAASHSHLILAQAESLPKPESRHINVINLTKPYGKHKDAHFMSFLLYFFFFEREKGDRGLLKYAHFITVKMINDLAPFYLIKSIGINPSTDFSRIQETT